jgi:signal transduction histidine kinase
VTGRRATQRDTKTPLSLATLDRGAIWRSALASAADAAADVLAASDGGWAAAELRAAASGVCATAEQVLRGIGRPTALLPPALPAKRILSEMRRALLRQSREGDLAPADAIALIDAVESIGAEIDQHAAHRFTSRLAGLGGLELLVDVAHDMRSPLGSILFLAEQLRQGRSGSVAPLQERQLGLIYSAALGLSGLTSDVMELARGGDRLVGATATPFSIAGVMQQVHDVVRPMAEERQLELRLSASTADARLGHARALQRVLLNLVTNAIKFTDSGSVAVSAHSAGEHSVVFKVVDTGRGIPEAVMGSLFDAFRRRLTSGQYVFSSAGLGLAICQRLIVAMGGQLSVSSPNGAGTTFRFELPLRQMEPTTAD